MVLKIKIKTNKIKSNENNEIKQERVCVYLYNAIMQTHTHAQLCKRIHTCMHACVHAPS